MKRKYVWVVVNDETGKPLRDMDGLLTVCGTKFDARSYAHYYSNVGMGKFRVHKYVAEGGCEAYWAVQETVSRIAAGSQDQPDYFIVN